VRRALGATARDIMREIGREGLPLVAAGIAIGLAGAALSGRLLQSQLFGVDPHDAVAYGAAIALIAAGSLAAAWIPARRAAVIDPVEVLKTE
jgi:ABC-type antimicrobial peptide transport system permease subunit